MKYILMFLIVVFSEVGFARCEQTPPPHTREDLDAVSRWAVGAAYANYAKRVGFVFNNETYMNDNPHKDLFIFGFGSTHCLEIDIINQCLSVMSALSNLYIEHLGSETEPDKAFSEVFLKMAEDSGMSKYLSPLENDPSSGNEIVAGNEDQTDLVPSVDSTFFRK